MGFIFLGLGVGSLVFWLGMVAGKLNNGKIYKNVSAIIIERDPYYKDYHVEFRDGTTDWILSEHIRKPYSRKK